VVRALMTAAVLVLLVAGCGGKDDPRVASGDKQPGATASGPSPTEDPRDRALKFVRCMRDQGIEIDDPEPDGRVKVRPNSKTDPTFPPAYEKCRSLLPGGAQAPPAPLTAAQLDKMREYARCMRDNGVTSFPDPGPEGFTTDVPQDHPAFARAYRACAHHVGADTSGGPGVG